MEGKVELVVDGQVELVVDVVSELPVLVGERASDLAINSEEKDIHGNTAPYWSSTLVLFVSDGEGLQTRTTA